MRRHADSPASTFCAFANSCGEFPVIYGAVPPFEGSTLNLNY